MKNKLLIGLLIGGTMLSLSACNLTEESTGDSVQSNINSTGSVNSEEVNSSEEMDSTIIDVPDNCNIELNETFNFETAAALYEGEIIFPEVVVTYKGTPVEINGKTFLANKLGIYTLTYTFNFNGDEKVETRTVNCKDTQAPTVLSVSQFRTKYEYGDIVTLPEFSIADLSGENITPEVKVYAGDEEISIINNQFMIRDYEPHKVVVTATDSSGNEAIKEYELDVRFENEFEYLNSKGVVNNALAITQGEINYNTNKDFIIEGNGSLQFTTNPNAMYPAFYFTDSILAEDDWKDIHSLSFWVYNASNYTFQFDFMTMSKKAELGQVLFKYTVPSKTWQYITVDASTVYNALLNSEIADTVGIFMNGSDQPNIFASMNFYFDAFEIHQTALDKDYSINVKNATYYKGDTDVAMIDVLTDADIGADVKLENITATLTDANGISTQLTLVDNKFSIPNKSGEYTISYLYRDGANGSTVKQKVVIDSDYQTLTTTNDFEKIDTVDSNQFDTLYGAGHFSIETDPTNSTNQVMVYSNDLSLGLYSAIKLGLTTEQLAILNPQTDTIRFDMYIELDTCNATNMNLRIKAAGVKNGPNDGQGDGDWLGAADGLMDQGSDNYNIGVWKTWTTVSGRAQTMEIVKNAGGLWLRIELVNAYNCGYKVYFDNIEIVKNGQVDTAVEDFVKSDIASAFCALTSDVTVADLEIKTETGEVVSLINGKVSAVGKYQVTALIAVNGKTKLYSIWVNLS